MIAPTTRNRLEIKVEPHPSREERIAAQMRQLMRAREAQDGIAAWLSSGTLGIELRMLLTHLLRDAPSWDSEGRWIDRISDREITIEPPWRCVVSGPAIWGDGQGNAEWAAPFEAQLVFTSQYGELSGYTMRFGDRRLFPDEGILDSVRRIPRDIENGSVDWSYGWDRPVQSS